MAWRIAFTAAPSEYPGAMSKERVTEGNCPWWLTVSGAVVCTRCTTADSGTGLPETLRT